MLEHFATEHGMYLQTTPSPSHDARAVPKERTTAPVAEGGEAPDEAADEDAFAEVPPDGEDAEKGGDVTAGDGRLLKGHLFFP